VSNGIREAGGLPMEAPVFATGECCLRPTAMMYRNLCAMDVEEIGRANPVDGMVLLVGCDKVMKQTSLYNAMRTTFLFCCSYSNSECKTLNAIMLKTDDTSMFNGGM
jgi:hypothetical protein